MQALHAIRIRFNKLFAPLQSARIARRYRALGGGPVSIIANNCAAGRMLHDLGQRLDTPTVNLWMTFSDFLDLVEHLHDALAGDLVEVKDLDEDNPVADLCFGTHKLRLHFLHETTFGEAKADWERRRRRVDPDRTFVVATDNSDASATELDRFLQLPFPKRMFVKDAWKAERLGKVGVLVHGHFRNGFNIHDFPGWFGVRHYQRSLDFAAWITDECSADDKGQWTDVRPIK